MNPEELLYCETHEWASIREESGEKIATIGISAFAVEQLTDLVYMELPSVGQQLEAGTEMGEVESVKAVSPVYSPVTGEVIEVHGELTDNLEVLNQDPYGDGWLVKVRISDESSLGGLLDYADYQTQCAEEG